MYCPITINKPWSTNCFWWKSSCWCVFVDISKAFEKVWHDGILYNLKAYAVQYELLSLYCNYLQKWKQGVVLNGQTSEWREIISEIPQGSVLEPLLFIIYINDPPDGIILLCKIFGDDTSLFSKVHNVSKYVNDLNAEKISQWAYQ